MTEGQKSALQQLQEVEGAGEGALEILRVEPPRLEGVSSVEIEVSLYCGRLERAEGGLAVRERERLLLEVPADFPFEIPSVLTVHRRFAGFPHVQWGRQLCLYQAPDTEWDASDGMFGFVDRLVSWLRAAALGELDPVGAPLHPPVAYSFYSDTLVIPRVDTPEIPGELGWFGAAQLDVVSEQRVDVLGWIDGAEDLESGRAAAALLLARPLSLFEFPTTVRGLLVALDRHGVPLRLVLLALQAAALRNTAEDPLYVLLGSPARGIAGSAERKQHLTAWRIDSDEAAKLRIAVLKGSKEQKYRQAGVTAEKEFLAWAEEASVSWCEIREDRPEVTVRRDRDTPVSWFRDRVVAIWGCGAIGGHTAEFLTRAGVKKLILRDNRAVTPGVLTRQPFDDADLGKNKAQALAGRLLRIRPAGLEVEWSTSSVLSDPLDGDSWGEGADLLVDATASSRVLKKIERRWSEKTPNRPPIASMVVGHHAERGLVVLAGPEFSGGPADVVRKAQLVAAGDAELADHHSEFWPSPEDRQARVFQPEPGCSDSTFVGSAPDMAVLTGLMLNRIAKDLGRGAVDTATAHFITQRPTAQERAADRSLSWRADTVLADPYLDYQVRLAPEASEEIFRRVRRSSRVRGKSIETGGLLFGERDDAAMVVWVTQASGPPPDSQFSKMGFVCGIVGTQALNDEIRERSAGSSQFVGMWHTHPTSAPIPSPTDRDGMAYMVDNAGFTSPRALLLILGHTTSEPVFGSYVYSRADRGRGLERPTRTQLGFITSARAGLVQFAYLGTRRLGAGSRRWRMQLRRAIRRLFGPLRARRRAG